MSELHSSVGIYVADALDLEERTDFETHLDHCAECRESVRELREALADASGLHEVAPPAALRASVLQQISSTEMLPYVKDGVTASTDPAPVAEEKPSNVVEGNFGRRRPMMARLAAAAAVLAVALGGVTLWQQNELQSFQAADAQRVELLSAPDLQVSTAALDGVDITYLVSQARGEGIIASEGLPSPGDDRSWQVWVFENDTPRSAAVVNDGGQVQVIVDGVAGGSAMAITNEPLGGSAQPTDDPQAYVELQTI